VLSLPFSGARLFPPLSVILASARLACARPLSTDAPVTGNHCCQEEFRPASKPLRWLHSRIRRAREIFKVEFIFGLLLILGICRAVANLFAAITQPVGAPSEERARFGNGPGAGAIVMLRLCGRRAGLRAWALLFLRVSAPCALSAGGCRLKELGRARQTWGFPLDRSHFSGARCAARKVARRPGVRQLTNTASGNSVPALGAGPLSLNLTTARAGLPARLAKRDTRARLAPVRGLQAALGRNFIISTRWSRQNALRKASEVSSTARRFYGLRFGGKF